MLDNSLTFPLVSSNKDSKFSVNIMCRKSIDIWHFLIYNY